MNAALTRTVLRLHEKLTGRRILQRLEELNCTQWLGRDELLALQQSKLQRLVEYAYRWVPYYRRTFDAVGFQPDDLRRDPECLAKLPTLTKAIIRENLQDMLTTEPDRRRRLNRLSTSGSTGHPLVFMQDDDFRDYVTADGQRHMGWGGWRLGKVHAFIWGAGLNASLAKAARTRLLDLAWNRFQTNAFMMTDASMAAFASRIMRQGPCTLFCYATALHRFAQFVRASDYHGMRFDGIFSSAEMLLPGVRAYLEETFQSPMFDRYGTLELGGVACECEAHTGLHVSVENNFVEILRDERRLGPGETGDVVVTNLNNLGMPFIRYLVGDAGAWHPEGSCRCGRAAPMLERIEGRKVDSFRTRDGRTVWAGFAGATFRCLAHPNIKQFQVVQKSLDLMLVRLVPEGSIPQAVLDEIARTIRQSFGVNVSVEFELSDVIAPLASGKHCYAVSELHGPSSPTAPAP
jgi:phenylacetate-CoA ligase